MFRSERRDPGKAARPPGRNPISITSRIDLIVPYVQKEDAKALGARWDVQKKVWYAPPGADLEYLRRWLPGDAGDLAVPAAVPSVDPGQEKGVSLSTLLSRVKGIVEQCVPEAVWVRAEITELRGKNNHQYLSLTEQNEGGIVLAKCKGIVWRSQAITIAAKFEQAIGEGLRDDIKILCLARVRFDPLYGLDMIIEDVDPSYTLGDLAAKLARIRQRLVDERLYDRNQALPAPTEFVRVAVISPETSAGLGDFRRETDRLEQAGLCYFHYQKATFQGLDAPSSLRTAVNEVLAAHRQSPFDALVVIRGGGSVTDLAWLNDLELARVLCKSPIPVLTGIGHERDSTILDEIAQRRFDTPSKVALHIAGTIRDNAAAAAADFDRIGVQVGRVLKTERTRLEAELERLGIGVGTRISQAREGHQAYMMSIRTAAYYQIREAGRSFESARERLLDDAENLLYRSELAIQGSLDSVTHRSELQVGELAADVERFAQGLTLRTKSAIDAADCDIEILRDRLGSEALCHVSQAHEGSDDALDSIGFRAMEMADDARTKIDSLARLVIGLGPDATLRRGFAIARDDEGRPITSRKEAMRGREFAVQFHDGSVPVVNKAFPGGE